VASATLPSYDPLCFLCPRNQRSTGAVNPDYKFNWIFENDFSALRGASATTVPSQEFSSSLFQVQEAQGRCFVHCFTSQHHQTLAHLSLEELCSTLATWKQVWNTLVNGACTPLTQQLNSDQNRFPYVQIFENKGAMMGCSNPHPHCQIWATEFIPTELEKERSQFQKYQQHHHCCLLCDYVEQELKFHQSQPMQSRMVWENETFLILVPFWATWPFETLILPKQHQSNIGELSTLEIEHLAQAFKTITTKYDELFKYVEGF
jgi:UDPglucose--hexose-1-phosphate uridylyltransferase